MRTSSGSASRPRPSSCYGYDGFSRLQSVLYGDGSGYSFTYDDATYQLLTVRDPTGRTLESHLYDGSGRAMTSEIASGQERLTLSYGTLQTMVTDALTHVTTYGAIGAVPTAFITGMGLGFSIHCRWACVTNTCAY